MKKCSNCGSSLSFSDKFCGQCGHAVPPSNLDFSSFSQYLINMILKPITTIGNKTKELELNLFYILLGSISVIYALINCLLTTLVIEQLADLLSSIFNELPFGMRSNYFLKEIIDSVPYSNIFLSSLVFFLFSSAILMVLIFVTLKFILKNNNIQFGDVLKIISSSYIPYMLFMIIGLILLFLNIYLFFACVIGGTFLSFLTLHKGLYFYCSDLEENKFSFGIIFSYIIMFLVKYITITTWIGNL